MTLEEIKAGIRKSWDYLKLCDVGQSFSNPAPLTASEAFKAVATSGTATYEEIYLTGLREGDYNVSLFDYSFVQFGGTTDNTLRYAYYPNPFLGSSVEAVSGLADLREYVEEGVISMDEYLHAIADLRSTQHPPVFRYENSFDQYVDLRHPCSHFHLGHHADNRWPLSRVLTPQAFTLLIIKHFYSAHWASCPKMVVGANEVSADELLITERQNCRILADEFFSDAAKRQFHFA